ncbi:alpha/beta fold hydrolase [Nocardia sp. NPDC059239]|uniref:alpha/beta fold hydrolase n=1 Tax=unclassified Nocardia TaxID=2637762 RepID=UPI0036BE59AE
MSIDIDGYATSVAVSGSGSTVLYLSDHILAGRWLPFHEQLASRFRTVAPVHPGFGGSTMPPGLRDFTDYVLHYDQLIQALAGDTPAHLVGNSFGAWIAAELAVFYPRRFASLTLIAPFGLRIPGEPAVDQFRWNEQERIVAMLNGDTETWGVLVDGGKSPESAVIDRYADSIAFARLAWNPRYDARLETRLSRISAPTTVIHPVDDKVASIDQATGFAQAVPGAKLVLLNPSVTTPASHLSVLAHPELLAARVADQVANANTKELA